MNRPRAPSKRYSRSTPQTPSRFFATVIRSSRWPEAAAVAMAVSPPSRAGSQMNATLAAFCSSTPEFPTVTWSSGVHAAVVEVDPETGRVKVLSYVIVHDCGRQLHPVVVDSRIVGGFAQ